MSRPSLLAAIMIVLVVAELLSIYTDLWGTGFISFVAILALPVIAWRSVQWREAYLLAICFVLVGLVWFSGLSLTEVLHDGLSRSAFLGCFILLMALLRSAAVTSSSVEEVGIFLTRQPPNRRFYSVFVGSHFFAVLINLGALSLLAPIVQRGVRATNNGEEALDEISFVRERRQLAAVIRGFSWFLVWAPTAVTQAVMPTLMAGIDPFKLTGIGLILALIMLVVSGAEDWFHWRPFHNRLAAEGRLPVVEKVRFPKAGFFNLGFVSLGLFGLPLLFVNAFTVNLIEGVMLAAPLVVVSWVMLQYRAEGGSGARFKVIVFDEVPGYVREAIFLGCAGFIGTVAAKLVPVNELALLLDLAEQPDWLILWFLTFAVWLFGQVGLSPITMAVFLGSLVAELPVMPVDITYVALAIAAGTAVCTYGAPFSSGAVMLSRATGYTTKELTLIWNGAYIAITLFVLAVFYALITQF